MTGRPPIGKQAMTPLERQQAAARQEPAKPE